MSQREIYFSIDVETDGPIPGVYSMLSLGCAAFTPELTGCAGTWSANLKPLSDAQEDPDTMNWWKTQPDAWAACHIDPADPSGAMQSFVNWVRSMARAERAKPVCVAYPAGFDFTFVYWYIRRFGLTSPFSFSCIDVKTYAMSLLNSGYRGASKRAMPKKWFSDLPHTHLAVDDAIEQGYLFMNMLKARQELVK